MERILCDDKDGFVTDDSASPSIESRRRRNCKKKRTNQKKRGSLQKTSRRGVTFGTTQTVEFGRCLGLDVVPGDGGWPLGLEYEAIEGIDGAYKTTVDDFESAKQARLLERWNKWSKENSNCEQHHEGEQGLLQSPPYVLETRQFDYRRNAKNPLFRMVSETERMKILLAYCSNESLFVSSSSGAPPPSTERKLTTQRSRSRSRSVAEEYSDSFPQVEVHHVRNELESIRNNRADGTSGCQCRKLVVYLLPPGGGGKKANSRRMHFSVLKQELRKRNLLPSSEAASTSPASRVELEVLLHEAIQNEACCSVSDDCFCARNNMNCQADTCACWWSSHQALRGSKAQDSSMATIRVEEIKERCGNKNGMYVVDEDEITDFREQFVCHNISTP
jgi:hypothetical protein